MGKQFDRSRPYSEIHGDSPASFFQDGAYFDGRGEQISAEEVAKPTANGSYANQVAAGVEQRMAEENAKKPLELVDETNPSTNRQEDIDKARQRVADAQKDAEPEKAPETVDDREQRLKKMHIGQLRKLVAELGIEPPTGRGAVSKCVELILANTE